MGSTKHKEQKELSLENWEAWIGTHEDWRPMRDCGDEIDARYSKELGILRFGDLEMLRYAITRIVRDGQRDDARCSSK